MQLLKDIKNIIFDFGGVIINIDFNLAYNAFKELGIPGFELISHKILKNDCLVDFEKGLISPDEFRDELRRLSGLNIDNKTLDSAWNKMLLDIPVERIRLLENLRNNYRIFLLSNTNLIHYDCYVANLKTCYGYNNFGEIFEKDYFSFNLGMYKPDSAIYEFVIRDSNLNPIETLFIDDLKKNTDAAKKIGMHTYFLKDGETINEILKNY